MKTFVFRIQFQKFNLQHTQVPLFPNPTRKIPEPMNFEKRQTKTHHTHHQQNQNIFVNPCFLRAFFAKPCLCSRCYAAQPRGEQHCPNSHLPAMMGGGHGPTTQSSTIKYCAINGSSPCGHWICLLQVTSINLWGAQQAESVWASKVSKGNLYMN